MSLVSLSAIKEFMGLAAGDTSEDARLTAIQNGVESSVLQFLNRDLSTQSYTEYHSGDGRFRSLYLQQRPVTAVSSVKVDNGGYFGQAEGAFGDAALWVAGEDYAVPDLTQHERNQSELIALNQPWPQGLGNIKVVYTAGYASIPYAIRIAIYQLVAQIYRGAEKGAVIAEETIGRYSYRCLNGSEQAGQDLARAIEALQQFREVTG